MSRPTKLTPELQEKICDSIAAGNYAETACAAAGVSTSTFYRWCDRGEKEESGSYVDFLAAVQAAEAEAEAKVVAVVQLGIQSDPRLAMTFLERRFPKRWQRRHQAEKDDAKPTPTAVTMSFTESRDAEGHLTRTIGTVDGDGNETIEVVERIDDADSIFSETRNAAKDAQHVIAPPVTREGAAAYAPSPPVTREGAAAYAPSPPVKREGAPAQAPSPPLVPLPRGT